MTHKKMIYGGAAVFLLGLIIWAIVTAAANLIRGLRCAAHHVLRK